MRIRREIERLVDVADFEAVPNLWCAHDAYLRQLEDQNDIFGARIWFDEQRDAHHSFVGRIWAWFESTQMPVEPGDSASQ